MECKLLDSTRVCLGRSCLNRFSRCRVDAVTFSNQFCSSRGMLIKASYSTTRKSKQSIDWVGQDNFTVANDSPWIIETNGIILSPSLVESTVLDYSEDKYDGVVIDPDRLPSNPKAFASILRASLSHWRLKGKKGIWLKLPVERSELVPIAVKEGFEYHHAERQYLMLTYWIPQGPSLLPDNASHHVGIGGFVINDQDEVLVVQEKYCPPACVGLWKLPTGYILESEEIYTGAVREVKEETGIDSEFVEVIAFRHALSVAFEKSDLFFICMLRPLSTKIKVDDQEIQAAKWMPLAEFVEQPLIKEDNMFYKIIEMCIARLGKRYCGLVSHRVVSKFDGKTSSLYYNVADSQDSICQGS
ncbi:hypothetical protein Scep_026674 [Stephania cephalantha]|uniref:Nudix hydrolase domain-containing protein n=1 Tax=Stephania cephalantha TaxID=152367 RepID=A0AAP0HTI4_9MAGN